jgi:hypothetical protein
LAPSCVKVHAVVSGAGKVARVDTFNGNYGLLRGLAAAFLVAAEYGGDNDQSGKRMLEKIPITPAEFASTSSVHG